MLQSLQLRPSAHRPPTTARGPVPLRFGEMDKVQLKAYKTAIQDVPDFGPNQKYGSAEFSDIYGKLKERAQKAFEKICKQITPQEVKALQKANLLGPIEESSDEEFELAALIALRQNIITETKVDEWRKKIFPDKKTEAARAAKPFETVLREIDRELPPEKVATFQKTLKLPPEQAHQMLLLLCAKYMLMRDRNPKFDIWKETKPLLFREAKELMEHHPLFSPRQLQIGGEALAYTYIPHLPTGFFHSELERIVSSRLKAHVMTRDLMANVIPKQYRRQEFNYYNPNIKENNDLKLVIKPLEVIEEAAVVKNTLLQRPIALMP